MSDDLAPDLLERPRLLDRRTDRACLVTDFTDFFDGPDDPSITLQREVCSSCFLELPATMVCGDCG